MATDDRFEGFDPAYLVTLDEIYHGQWAAGQKHKIEKFRQLLATCWPNGHPTRLIHVTGTNGKGSVCHYLAQGLMLAGRTGSWTGPHVFDYAERIHIDAEPLSHDQLVEIYRGKVEPLQRRLAEQDDAPLGFAEVGILISLFAFEAAGARWGLMEVGVGGRYTPLKALPQAACVVTNVGRDHAATLGSELWQRALEKAGLVAAGGQLFTAAEGDAREYVTRAAEADGAAVHALAAADVAAVRAGFEQPLADYDAVNLALARRVVSQLEPTLDLAAALAAMRRHLAGRFWYAWPDLLVDIAHNADKVAALAGRLAHDFPGRQFVFVVGLTRQRDPVEVFGPLLPLAREIIVTDASHAGQPPAAVAAQLKAHCDAAVSSCADPATAVGIARDRSGSGVPAVLTGSGYTVDLALNPNRFIRHSNASFGWRYRRAEGEIPPRA